jgi:hypothetical protein
MRIPPLLSFAKNPRGEVNHRQVLSKSHNFKRNVSVGNVLPLSPFPSFLEMKVIPLYQKTKGH